jgi:hypothetical protein
MWQTVNNAVGSYNAKIDPKWWNNTSPMMLQLAIVSSGSPSFLSPFPAGPVFTATHPSGAALSNTGASNTDSGITYVNNMGAAKKSLPPGSKAAAALFPILILIGVLVALYVRRVRTKAKEKSM